MASIAPEPSRFPAPARPQRTRSASLPVTCDVSIVMPCLNEEQAVGRCVETAARWLAESGKTGEVIVVDNGSTDGSVHVAEAAGARMVHESARGYGYALLRGIDEASGAVIVMGDCDDTYDFERLSELVEPLDDGYDISIGNRYAGGIEPGAMTWSHRHIGTPVISWLLKVFAGVDHGDSQCGLRAFTREAAEVMDLRSGGMEFASEMLLKASRRGLSIAEVPIPYRNRIGEAKLRTMSDGWRHLRFLLLATPTWLFLIPGVLLALMGAATIAWSLIVPKSVVVGTLDWQPTFAGTIFLVVGINAFSLGLVSRSYNDAIGLTSEGPISRFVRQYVSFEALGVAGLALGLTGLGIDGFLFWMGEVRGVLLEDRHALASLAQSSIIIGANLFLVGALGGLIARE